MKEYSSYIIKDYTKKKAKKLDLLVYPSDDPTKKIDVYSARNGLFLARIGDVEYMDYPYYLEHDEDYAKERRRLYKIRHNKHRKKEGSTSWFADQLLW